MLANINITGSSSLAEGASSAFTTISPFLTFLIGIIIAIFILEALTAHFRDKNNAN